MILTAVSHMAGITCSKLRRLRVPEAIAAGCDMFFDDVEEDFEYMLRGYKEGIITPEGFQDAVMRILGLKASLKLHEKQKSGKLISDKDNLRIIGCRAHRELAQNAADKSITLVKIHKIFYLYLQKCINMYVFLLSAILLYRGGINRILLRELYVRK